MIFFTYTLYELDTWDPNDYVDVQFDSTVLSSNWMMGWGSWSQKNYVCGWSSYPDLTNMRVFGKVAHSASTLAMRFTSRNDEDSNNESAGFRDLKLLFATTSDSVGTTQSQCVVTWQAFSSGNCQCAEGYYYSTTSSSCQACNSLCSSCWGASSAQCYQCASGAGWTGSACVTCDSSCGSCFGSGANQCATCASGLVRYYSASGFYCTSASNIQSPMSVTSDSCGNNFASSSCTSSQFVYWDSSCQATCKFPLGQVVKTSYLSYCTYPCSTSQYLLWNGNCASSCPYPSTARTTNSRNFCDYPIAYNQDSSNKF